jgi:hypothetical protein
MTSPRSFTAVLLWLCFCCFAASSQIAAQQPQNQPPEAKADTQNKPPYTLLVERAKKGEATVDYVQMRDAFVEWVNDDKNKTEAPDRDKMVEAFKKDDYAKATELVEIVLDYEFVNRNLHLAAEDAYRKLGDETKANFHRDIAQKLLQALLSTGDGKTAETAYRVLTVKEEYLIMKELGYTVSSQSLMSIKGNHYDVLSGVDKKTGKEVELYFEIGSFFGGGKKNEK